MANQDTELTLSTGKLLGIFFGMVAICAVFFSLGYAVGKGAGSANAQVITDSSELSSISSTGGVKPTPARPAPVAEATPEVVPPAAETAKTETPSAEQAKTTAPELKNATSAGFMVQVAAVSKKEDADSLVNALRKKQYPVLLVSNQPNSSLYHVQVGPFADQKDAESMRTRLATDGYNAILKK
ncbi:MAG TPA: SPOR domain-containing protein [Terriglobales bacterium]|nr:SPOR domain-containing protein [Terriglobales bacterium]